MDHERGMLPTQPSMHASKMATARAGGDGDGGGGMKFLDRELRRAEGIRFPVTRQKFLI